MNMTSSTIAGSVPGQLPLTPAQRAHRRSVWFLRWLRRMHLWLGLWGAVLGLLFGVTGLMMNHRAVMKIPVERMVQRQTQLPLPIGQPPPFSDAASMADWIRRELKLGEATGRVRVEATRSVPWGDRSLMQPERWSVDFAGPTRQIRAEYWVGNQSIRIEAMDATAWGVLMRLHTSTGVSAFWVLLTDSVAGAMVLLSLTGLLLWSRLHSVKLATIGLGAGATLAAAAYLLLAA